LWTPIGAERPKSPIAESDLPHPLGPRYQRNRQGTTRGASELVSGGKLESTDPVDPRPRLKVEHLGGPPNATLNLQVRTVPPLTGSALILAPGLAALVVGGLAGGIWAWRRHRNRGGFKPSTPATRGLALLARRPDRASQGSDLPDSRWYLDHGGIGDAAEV
jgi:hypothetical protein